MPENRVHFSTIADFNEFMQVPKPNHPMVSVCQVSDSAPNGDYICSQTGVTFSNDFYMIAVKNIISGDFHYGRTKYDFTNGTMMFMAPRQEMRANNLVVSSDALIIAIHEDFVKGHPIRDTIKKYGFFSYATNEALHLSPKEEILVRSLMSNIHHEYQENPDEFSKDLLLSQIDTLLKYSDRYYKRQFLNRSDITSEISERFDTALRRYFEAGKFNSTGIPKVDDIANELQMSARYLSDSLKSETGKAAQEHIHHYLLDEAKDMLLDSKTSVSEVAYKLGFDYPQYFSRLFKKKIGISPKEYRDQNTVH